MSGNMPTVPNRLDGVRASLSAFAEAFRASFSPRTEDEASFVERQLTIALQGAGRTWYLLPAVAVLIAMANIAWVPLWRLVAWPALLITACVGSGLYFRHAAAKADASTIAGIRRKARGFALGTLAQCFALCSVGVLLWSPQSTANHVFISILLCATLAGWASVGTFHFATGVLSLPVYLFILMLGPVASGNPVSMGIAFAYWFVMAALFGVNYGTRERMMRLEIERGALIENLKMAKAESDGARERAEEANRAKSAFLANMSHELRTPLNAILGFSEIINTRAMGRDAMDQYAEYAGYIHGSGEHLLSLINDILDLAKIEAGRMVLRETELDLRSIMDDTAKMMSAKAVAGGLSLAVHIDRSFPNVYADDRAVRQMMVNLASNAIKFTPANGRVTAFANVLPDGSLAFGVDDTGVGIAPEDHAKVFESFGQGRHDAVLSDKGTGLGLPIVKGLAEAHGGTIMLNSVPHEGTRITVIFPPERARARFRAAS
jgi:two-component system cell cycle sensor histidine kinase PleC